MNNTCQLHNEQIDEWGYCASCAVEERELELRRKDDEYLAAVMARNRMHSWVEMVS